MVKNLSLAADTVPGLHGERRAVVLLSGGLDSTVTLAYARREGYTCHALTVDYGQRHRLEIERAARSARALGAREHKVLSVDLRSFGGSVLTSDGPLPEARAAIGPEAGIPGTYVPARNTVFLSLALAWAEVLRAEAIYIGANAVDYSGYPDCRPEYFKAFVSLARLATKAGDQDHWTVRIEAPLLYLSKAEIVRLGRDLNVDFSLTSSCYDPSPDDRPCGICEACLLRRKGFREAGEKDPTEANFPKQ
jgi:7-cyano-7-deazaguanine synthase